MLAARSIFWLTTMKKTSQNGKVVEVLEYTLNQQKKH